MEKLIKDITEIATGKENEVSKENANKDARTFPTRRDLIAGAVSKQIAKTVLPEHIYKAHVDGDIHYHDMDYAPAMPFTNCCLVNLKDMLENGFKLGSAQIESPKSIGVACAVTAQIIAQVASHQYGGTTIANIDQVLAPYVEKTYHKHLADAETYGIKADTLYAQEKTEKETLDGYQALEYEINTLFSTNGQTPFVTLTFGMGTSWEEKLIQKAILNVRTKGLGKDGITPVFPKLVMFLEEGLNLKPEDPNYDIKQMALECSSKRLYPDYISAKNNRSITGSSVPVSPMGCRSFLGVWHNEKGEEVLDGRNNLGVVTLNLPRIALIAARRAGKASVMRRIELFEQELANRMPICFDALMSRVDALKGAKANVAPVLYTEGAFFRIHQNDEILEVLKDGRASISLGYIGLHEVLSVLFGVHPFDSEDAQRYGKHILKILRHYTEKWKDETGLGFSLYGTPAESLCYRFNRLDREKFGIVKGATDKDWYTNSFHLDVDRKVTPFEKIDFEKDYHWLASGGMISYVEFPDMKNNLKGLETVVDYAMDKLHYFGVNTPSDVCHVCGSTKEMRATESGFVCPDCGNDNLEKMNVIRRVSGYLGSVDLRPFNHGKHSEMVNRVKHM